MLIRNDETGEPVVFVQHKKVDGPLDLGELAPGDAFAVNLEGLIGVYARSTTKNADSFVQCIVSVIQ